MRAVASAFLAAEPLIRVGAFAGVFLLMAVWEVLAPRRVQPIGRRVRWPNNLGVVVADTPAVRFLFPTAAVGLARIGEDREWGLLNNFILPRWFSVVISVVLLD